MNFEFKNFAQIAIFIIGIMSAIQFSLKSNAVESGEAKKEFTQLNEKVDAFYKILINRCLDATLKNNYQKSKLEEVSMEYLYRPDENYHSWLEKNSCNYIRENATTIKIFVKNNRIKLIFTWLFPSINESMRKIHRHRLYENSPTAPGNERANDNDISDLLGQGRKKKNHIFNSSET